MANQSLTPINRKPKFKPFGVLDFETQDWIEFVSVGVFDHRPFTWFDYVDGLDSLFEYIFDEQDDLDEDERTKIYFAHFAGKFDFLFLLDFCLKSTKYKFVSGIPRGSMIMTFKIAYKDWEIQFWDSSALLQFSLRKLTKSFGVESLKGDIDYNFIRHSYDNEDYSPLLFRKCERKKQVGQEVDGTPIFEKYQDDEFIVYYNEKKIKKLPKNYKKELITYYIKEDIEFWENDPKKSDATKPPLHKVYSRHEHIAYLKNDCEGLHQVITKFYQWPLVQKSGQAFTIASQALKIFRTFLDRDIPSLSDKDDEFCRKSYFGGRTEIFKPYYLDEKIPLRCHDVNSLYPKVMQDNEFPLRPIARTKKFQKGKLAIYHCKVFVPKMHVPPLPCKHNGKLIFPCGTFEGHFVGSELEMALGVGVKILKIYDGIIFESAGKLFKDYIGHLYQIRLEKGGDSVDGMIAKLIMNSSYGKFGQGMEKENLAWETGEDATEEVFHEVQMDDGSIMALCKRTQEIRSFTNVAIASFVTSYARQLMYPYYLKCGKDIYYTDTDSIYSTIDFGSTKELGGLKEEEQTSEACFLLPKTYITEAKLKMKGFEKKSLKFNFEDFVNALQGELGTLRYTIKSRPMTFKQAIQRRGKVLALAPESEKRIQSEYDKRRVIKTEDVRNWTTEPYFLEETA